LALVEAIQEGRMKPGDTVGMVAFGSGLSWAGAVVKMGMDVPQAVAIPELSEVNA
jgi:3-oxoacyl-[acyl-carrier-protein] synthase-3